MFKYPAPIDNAATLMYGIICDHQFHNGHKRTGLVAVLAHLDKNKLSLTEARERDLFRLVIAIAKHELSLYRRRSRSQIDGMDVDEEIRTISEWLKDRVTPVRRGERQITFRQLRRILGHFRFELENPQGNIIDITRIERHRDFFGRERLVRKRVGPIGYPGERHVLDLTAIRHVRKLCKLREEDGVTSDAFYDEGEIIDTFINRYRKILYRLANR